MVLIVMKPLALISALALCWNFVARAQGVHLTAGDTLSIGFSRFDGCHAFDGPADTGVTLVFGNDLLGVGDSLRIEMLADTLEDSAFKTAVFNPAAQTPSIGLTGPYTGWLDGQGFLRVSMLTGTVDVDYAHFFLDRVSTYCDAVVLVPEPETTTLFAVAAAGAALMRSFRCRRNPGTHPPPD